jgi:hypothetical protein
VPLTTGRPELEAGSGLKQSAAQAKLATNRLPVRRGNLERRNLENGRDELTAVAYNRRLPAQQGAGHPVNSGPDGLTGPEALAVVGDGPDLVGP